jgi:hypothetical protein
MFEKKTWVNRQSEHPARRRLTPTGNDNEFDVARAEGVIMEDGDAFDAETMNDLEKRVAEGFSTLDPADLGADVCVQVYACVKSGTVYELTGSGAVGRCKIPAAWNSGDTWSVNGKAVPAYCGADAVDSDCIVAGRWVLFTFDGQRLDFNGGGGLSSGKLAQATAAESDVLSGKKFYAGNKNLKTGTMHNNGRWPDAEKLTLEGSKIWMYQKQNGYLEGGLGIDASNLGNASPGHVLSGVSASSSNGLKFGGTMTNRGAVSASVDPGSTYTIPAGYHNGNGKVSGNRKYTTVYLGQQDSPWTGFSYNVKANYPSIYNKISRNNFIAIPHKYDGGCGDGSYRNAGDCGDFISYNASTGVVTMNGFGVGTQNQIRMTVMFKLYMIY